MFLEYFRYKFGYVGVYLFYLITTIFISLLEAGEYRKIAGCQSLFDTESAKSGTDSVWSDTKSAKSDTDSAFFCVQKIEN